MFVGTLTTNVEVYPTSDQDNSGLSAQISRLMNMRSWPPGEAALVFELDELHRIQVIKIESGDGELALMLKDYLADKEVYPRLNSLGQQFKLKIVIREVARNI
ncbi:MAG: hypothetical protein D6730_19700 [Bacteroidetes bacterium]|nr:MAG: hypothetical protein D6730_19700 [Bacteroidota bacterium]